MKILNKALSLFLATTMTLGLAACGAPAENNNTSSGETTNDGNLSGTLNYWTNWNDAEPQGVALQTIADSFMEQHPDVTINIQFCGRDLQKILKASLEAGEQIDMFDYPNQYHDQLKSYCADLTPILDKPYDSLEGKTLNDVLLPSMLTTPKALTGITEDQCSIGYKPYQGLMMYSVSAFEKAGITQAPTTWEELDAVCAQLKEAGYSPITFDDAYALFLPGMYLVRSKGQDWVHELVYDKTGELWRDEAVLNMAKAFEDFAKKGYFDENVGGNKWPAGQMDLANGKVAMYQNLTGLPGEVADITGPDFKWGAFNFPDTVEGENQAANAAQSSCTMMTVSNKCENFDLAAEFIAFVHSKENDDVMVKNGMVTSRKDGSWPDGWENIKDTFNSITVPLEVAGGLQSNADLKPIIAENFTKLASGKITADQFVENMATAAKA